MNVSANKPMFDKVAQGLTAATTLALTAMVVLAILTIIATDKARTRTECLQAAQTAEQCPVAGKWEVMLRKGLGL